MFYILNILTFAAIINLNRSMYSSSDFERLVIRYKAEAVPWSEFRQDFCLCNKIPYILFHKWYKDTRHQLLPVQVESQQDSISNASFVSSSAQEVSQHLDSAPLKIMIEFA